MIVSLLPFFCSLGLLAALLLVLEKALHELHFGTRGWSRWLFFALAGGLCPSLFRLLFFEKNWSAGAVLLGWAAAIWAAFFCLEREKRQAGLGLFSLAWAGLLAFFFEPDSVAAFDLEKLKTALFWPFSIRFWPVLPVFLMLTKRTDRQFLAKKALLAGAVVGSAASIFAAADDQKAVLLAAYFSAVLAVFSVWDRGLLLGLEFVKKNWVWAAVVLLFLAQAAGFVFAF